jgi:hypothetical protein
MGDEPEELNLALSIEILSMAVLEEFALLLQNSMHVSDCMSIVKSLFVFCRCFHSSDLCLCLHRFYT